MIKSRLPFYAFVAIIILATRASGDEVVIENGDRLQGEMVSMAGKKLVLKTSYAGNLTIDWGKVLRITTKGPVEVTLDNEKAVKGELVNSPEDRVLAVKSDPGSASATFMIAEIERLEPVKEKGWEFTGHLNLGINIESGNTEKQYFHFDTDAQIVNPPHQIKLFAETTVETNDEVRTDDKQFFNASYSYFLTRKWSVRTDTRFSARPICRLDSLRSGFRWPGLSALAL